MDLKRGVDAAAAAVFERLLKCRASEEQTEIAHVATISAQDEKIGELIAEAFSKVGKDGVITVEESPTMGLSWSSPRACSSTRATARRTLSPTLSASSRRSWRTRTS